MAYMDDERKTNEELDTKYGNLFALSTNIPDKNAYHKLLK
jgi:hypothetical protein